jgi:hypothetical protein
MSTHEKETIFIKGQQVEGLNQFLTAFFFLSYCNVNPDSPKLTVGDQSIFGKNYYHFSIHWYRYKEL